VHSIVLKESTMNAPEPLVHQMISSAESDYFVPNSPRKLTVNVDYRGADAFKVSKLVDVDVAIEKGSKIGCLKGQPELRKKNSFNSSFSSSQSSPVTTKKVRFATDRNGRIVVEKHCDYTRRNEQEAKDSWYSQGEFLQFRRKCKREAIQMRNTIYREHFAAVYKACSTGKFKSVTKERAYVSAATCRGLELVVNPELYTNRKKVINEFLETQAMLPLDMCLSKREETLANTSRSLTKQARQFARLLGSGDAAVVIANNRIEANKKRNVPHVFTL
jgi:hypothetical protein